MPFAFDPGYVYDPIPTLKARIGDTRVESLSLSEKDETVSLLDRVLLKSFNLVAEDNWSSLLKLGDRLRKRIMAYPVTGQSYEDAMAEAVKNILANDEGYQSMIKEIAEDRVLFDKMMKYGDYVLHIAWEQLPDYARQNIMEPNVGCAKCRDDWDNYFEKANKATKMRTLENDLDSAYSRLDNKFNDYQEQLREEHRHRRLHPHHGSGERVEDEEPPPEKLFTVNLDAKKEKEETKTVFKPNTEELRKREDDLKNKLEAIILLFLLDRLSRELAYAQGLELIEQTRSAIISDLNEQASKLGLEEVSEESVRETIAKIEEDFDALLAESSAGEITKEETLLRSSLLTTAIVWGVLSSATIALAENNAALVDRVSFVTQEDELVCLACREAAGTYLLADEDFQIPPLHPNCRCYLIFGVE